MATLQAGDLHGADELFSRAVAMNPGDAGSWNVLALIALQTARTDLALERAKRAHELDRRHPDYLNTMGLALGEQGDLSTAEAVFRRALKARPGSAELHYNHGRTLYRQSRPHEALAAYKRACAIDPRYPGALNNQAAVLFELARPAEARRVLEQAVAADPGDEVALDNLATAVFKAEGPAAACKVFNEHLARHPRLDQARHSYAMTLLASGEFSEGWKQYRLCARSRERSDVDAIDRFPDDMRGRSVLLRTEQGLGDVLFFLRFVPRLRELGARVTVESPAKLRPVLSGHAMLERVIPEAGPGRPAGYDLAVHLGDLPALVGGTPGAHFPLQPDAAMTAEMLRLLATAGPGPYVGLTWRAGTVKRDGFVQAAELALFKEAPLSDLARALPGSSSTIVVLQRDPVQAELDLLGRILGRPVCDMSRLNDDLPRMVAVLGIIDDYVGVSNTNMHLRHALGKTARVLVRGRPGEWRWMLEGDSPWFPGFAVYRQGPGNHWTEALRALRADLAGREGGA